ncbi:MAG: hypothetical protein Q9160_003368 [Pyrenula sp. 1 TL-2023]
MRETWTCSDLEAAVQQARHRWNSKSRVGGGKPQRMFHNLMRKFDAHSGLCAVIPTHDKYLSLVTGGFTILVKASTAHSKTSEELNDALEKISETVALCDVEVRLIRSQAMQNAVAKLYIAIFLFLGDAITWYNSSSKSKVLNSLQNDYSIGFRTAVDRIEKMAAYVHHVAQLGSAAETRVARLELEELQNELQDMRVGLHGQLRAIAELIRWERGENAEQHRQTQALLAEMRASIAASASSVPQMSSNQQSLLSVGPPGCDFQNAASQDLVPTAFAQLSVRTDIGNELPTLMQGETIKQSVQRLWTERWLNELLQLLPDRAPSPNLHLHQISSTVNHWLSSYQKPLLYLEFSAQNAHGMLRDAAAQILRVCDTSGSQTVSYYPLQHSTPAKTIGVQVSPVIDMMLDLAHQFIAYWPKTTPRFPIFSPPQTLYPPLRLKTSRPKLLQDYLPTPSRHPCHRNYTSSLMPFTPSRE